jgi:hypothetical protein
LASSRAPSAAWCENSASAAMTAKVFGFGLCTAATLKNGSEKLRDGDGPPVGTIEKYRP